MHFVRIIASRFLITNDRTPRSFNSVINNSLTLLLSFFILFNFVVNVFVISFSIGCTVILFIFNYFTFQKIASIQITNFQLSLHLMPIIFTWHTSYLPFRRTFNFQHNSIASNTVRTSSNKTVFRMWQTTKLSHCYTVSPQEFVKSGCVFFMFNTVFKNFQTGFVKLFFHNTTFSKNNVVNSTKCIFAFHNNAKVTSGNHIITHFVPSG